MRGNLIYALVFGKAFAIWKGLWWGGWVKKQATGQTLWPDNCHSCARLSFPPADTIFCLAVAGTATFFFVILSAAKNLTIEVTTTVITSADRLYISEAISLLHKTNSPIH